MITYTKNKTTGEFDIIGPAADIVSGAIVEVEKRDGTTNKVKVGKVSKPFTAKFGQHEGEEVVIATIEKD